MDIRQLLDDIKEAESDLSKIKRLSEALKSDNYTGVRVDFLVRRNVLTSSANEKFEKSITFPGITFFEISSLTTKKLKEAETKVEELSQMLQACEEKANEVLDEMNPKDYGC